MPERKKKTASTRKATAAKARPRAATKPAAKAKPTKRRDVLKAKPAKSKPAKVKLAKAKSAPSRGESPKAEKVLAPVSQPQAIRETKPKGPPAAPDAAREFAVESARLVFDDKCSDVVLLDVRNKSQVTNYIVIGSGTSDRQMRSVLQHVEDLGKQRGFTPWRTDKDTEGRWLLLDCVDVVVHLFTPNTRSHYDLEMMWGDAPRMEWERPDQIPRDRAKLNA